MVIHFELHPSWTQSLLFGDAIKAGVSLGKDNHWHRMFQNALQPQSTT